MARSMTVSLPRKNTFLLVNGSNKRVQFKAGTVVTFDEKSQVVNNVANSIDPLTIIEGTWKNTDHVHQGCRDVQSFYKAYKLDVLFSKESNGELKALLVGQDFIMIGNLQGQTYNFSATMNGSAHGNGSFVFSDDFRSFNGEFTDVNGHHVVWSGSRQ